MTSVLLDTVQDQGEADVICSFLRIDGIPCSTRSVHGGTEFAVAGEGFVGTGPCEIYVDESDVERARELVTAMRSRDERGRI